MEQITSRTIPIEHQIVVGSHWTCSLEEFRHAAMKPHDLLVGRDFRLYPVTNEI